MPAVAMPRPMSAVRSGNWKLVMDGPRPLLFDLSADIGERENLVGARADVARRLRTLLDAWIAEVDAERQGAGGR